MARRKSRTLTELELEIMQVVWGKGEALVEDVVQALGNSEKPLTPQSVRTMLKILGEKGYVMRRKEGRGHAYSATVPREQAKKGFLKDLVERVFDGSASSLVAALVNAKMVSEKELGEIRRLIGEHEKREEP
jgi:BlaI family penicillinase repressor